MLKENEIRPSDLMAKAKDAAMKDVSRLLSRIDEFEHTDCPACGSNHNSFKYEKYGFNYSVCSQCNTFYMNPRPKSEVLEWFYKDSINYQFWNDFIFPATDESRKQNIFQPRVDRMVHYLNTFSPNAQSIVEVGCAFGTFLELAKSSWSFERIVGVEPTPALAQTARNKGIEVIEDVIENIELSEHLKFDVLTNFEVIEHLGDPLGFLEKSAKLLVDGGIIMISCPNGEGFDFSILGKECNSVDHEHLNYFNPTSIETLLKRAGFEVLEVTTPGELDVDLVTSKINELGVDFGLSAWLLKLMKTHPDKLQNLLKETNSSSSLWVVARKV